MLLDRQSILSDSKTVIDAYEQLAKQEDTLYTS